MTPSAVGFRLRRTVFATILFYVFGIFSVVAALLWACLAFIEWLGKEPAFNPVAATPFLLLLVAVSAPQFSLALWAAGAVLRREKVLMIDAHTMRLTGPKPLILERAQIESLSRRSSLWRPWSEVVIINLHGGTQAYLWSCHFEGGGQAILEALEAGNPESGPWS